MVCRVRASGHQAVDRTVDAARQPHAPLRHESLQQLIEQFQKDQPLSGDSLAVLQGAQAALARVNTALRSRGSSPSAPRTSGKSSCRAPLSVSSSGTPRSSTARIARNVPKGAYGA